jgi:diaminopimelate decarboxylase
MCFFPDVACNACPWVLTSLDEMNVKFSCQSKVEIQHVLDQGIDSSKIYFAGQTKVSKYNTKAVLPLNSRYFFHTQLIFVRNFIDKKVENRKN